MVLDGAQEDTFGSSATLLDKSTIAAFQYFHLPTSNLSSEGADTKIFYGLNHSLISQTVLFFL